MSPGGDQAPAEPEDADTGGTSHEGPSISPEDADAFLDGYRCVQAILRGERAQFNTDDDLEHLVRVCCCLATLAANQRIKYGQAQGLDEAEARAGAIIEIDLEARDIELAIMDDGRLLPPAPPDAVS